MMLNQARILSTVLTTSMVLFSATTVLAVNATWTGLGATDNWSDLDNWRLAGGATWADDDPRLVAAGGYFLLNNDDPTYDTTTSIVDLDTSTGGWNAVHSGRLYLNSDTRLYIPAGGSLDRERFLAEVGAEIHIDGGFFGADVRNSTGFLVDITAGSWTNARWTYSAGGTLHIDGSTPTSVHTNGFVSWNTSATPTLQFTLDNGGVTPFSIGGDGEFHPHSEPTIPGFITIEVNGIDNYLAGGGMPGDIIDLVVLPSGVNYPANWTTGLVDNDKGLVTVNNDGVTLTIQAIPGLPTTYNITPHDVGAAGGVEVLGGTITTNGTLGPGLSFSDLEPTFQLELTNGDTAQILTELDAAIAMSIDPPLFDVTEETITFLPDAGQFIRFVGDEAPFGGLFWSGESPHDSGLLAVEVDGISEITTPPPIDIGNFAVRASGDANGDGIVDAADLALVLANWSTGDSYATGDFNGDDTVDAADLSRLFGTPADPASAQFASVPEPSAFVLTALGMLGLIGMRRRRRA